MTFLRVLEQLLVPSLMLFVLVGSAGGFVLGCGLLLRTEPTLRFIHAMNRWVSTRRATRELEIPRDSLGPSKWLATLLVLGGATAAYFLVVRVQVPRAALSVADPRFGTGLAVEFAKWLLVAGCAASVAIGIVALFFPGRFADLQAGMNRWVSVRTLIPADSERMRTPLDLLVEAHPRTSGWIMAVSSLAVAGAMTALLVTRWLR